MRMSWLLAGACIVSATCCAFGQGTPALAGLAQSSASPIAKLPEFEVASVKPSSPNQREMNGFYTYPGGRIVGQGCRLQFLMMVAFNVQRWQISGGPGWTDLITGDSYDIQAIPPASSQAAHLNPAIAKNPPSDEQRQMLQALLMDRFQLRYHIEQREGPVYLLERGKGELKLSPPKDPNTFPWAGAVSGGWFGGGIRGENISMPQLAVRLNRFLERPVLDQTGLQGSFDFEYRNNDGQNDADITGFLLTAMKAIGLELKSGKGPIQTIVIDHAERPSPN